MLVKVVVHCQANTRHITGEKGVKWNLERQLGYCLAYSPFTGYLAGDKLQAFLKECQEADVVITDAWTHPEKKPINATKAEKEMRQIVEKIKIINPTAVIFTQLMAGKQEVVAHQIAKPHENYQDESIIFALTNAQALKRNFDHSLVMVVDNQAKNLRAAQNQFSDRGLIVFSSYLEAIAMLDRDPQLAAVMTDLMMPYESTNRRHDGHKIFKQEAPMGVFVAIKALAMGVRKIFIVSDIDYCDHPAENAAELLASSTEPIRWFCGKNCQLIDGRVKNWQTILNS